MSELLKSLKGNEQIAQVAQDKWATVRDSLRSIIINEQMSDALKKFWLNKSKILFFSMLCIGFLNNKMSDLLIPSFMVSDVSESLRSLTINERCEQIAQGAHQKWATISNSLRSLRANRSFFWANCSFAIFWAKNEPFTRKTNERILSPALEWETSKSVTSRLTNPTTANFWKK